MVCQFFTGSFGSNFLDWLVGVKGERGGSKISSMVILKAVPYCGFKEMFKGKFHEW